jgi:hypothetical protein
MLRPSLIATGVGRATGVDGALATRAARATNPASPKGAQTKMALETSNESVRLDVIIYYDAEGASGTDAVPPRLIRKHPIRDDLSCLPCSA